MNVDEGGVLGLLFDTRKRIDFVSREFEEVTSSLARANYECIQSETTSIRSPVEDFLAQQLAHCATWASLPVITVSEAVRFSRISVGKITWSRS